MGVVFNPFTGTLDFVGGRTNGTTPSDSAAKLIDEYIAAETISALQAVKLVDENSCELADSELTFDEGKVVGLALNAGTVGTTIRVQTFGIVEDASFTFPLNEPLFLKTNGTISNIPNTSGFNVQIGHSLGNGAIFVQIREPIEL